MSTIDDSANTPPQVRPPGRFDRWPVWLLSAAAGAVAAKLGWDFGMQLSGVVLGLITAANLGVIAALLVGAGAEKLWALLKRR